MLFTLFNLLDASTFCGQVLQAAIQVFFWLYAFKSIKSYLTSNFRRSSWYIQACRDGDGEPEFLMILCAIPQHTVSAVFVFLGYYFTSLQLFTLGTLGEFAFEFIELFNLFTSKYIYNNCPLSEPVFKAMIFHHLPGVLVIIPTNLFFGDNVYIQKIAFSLLAIAPALALFCVLYKTRNVYDLQQRGQFTVYSLLNILALLWFRFYWTPSIMIDFFADEFFNFSMFSQIMFIFYGVLINLFNVLFTVVLCQRLYGFLYGNKGVSKRPLADVKPTIPLLKRCRSTPLCVDTAQHKKMS